MRLKESLKEKSAKNPISDLSINLEWISILETKSNEVFNTIIPTEGLQLVIELGEDSRLREWLRVGYEIHGDKQKPVKCEFCTNEISEQRFKELANYFSDALRNLINNIEQIEKTISSGELPKIKIDKGQFYSEFQFEISDLNNEFYKEIDIIRNELKNLNQRLIEKRNNPSQRIEFNFEIIIKAKENLNQIISKINSITKKHNEKSQSFNKLRENDAHTLEIAIVNQNKEDYNNKIAELRQIESEIKIIKEEFISLEKQKTELEQKLKEHSLAAEVFNKLLASFLGRNEIKLEPVEDGYIINRYGTIANNLSEGERNAIALIFFLLKLEEETFDRTNGIVVIDDPVSSFDSQNLYGAFGLIKERLKRINPQQIFIFTHNFPFFRLVKNWMKYNKDTTGGHQFYQIKTKLHVGIRFSVIEKLDKLLKENPSEYSDLFKLIYKRASEDNSDLEKDYIFPNVIRKFLENYLSFKIPTGKDSSYDKFEKLCKDYSNLSTQSICQIEYYCQEQSHPLHQDSPIDFDERSLGEIQSVCKATIELVEKTDPNHYNYLLTECGFPAQ